MQQNRFAGANKSWNTTGSLIGSGLFTGVNPTVAHQINRIEKSTPNIQLRADDGIGLMAEALVAISWRESIIAIPRMIVPNGERGGFTILSIDERGEPRKPLPCAKPSVIAFMDWVHLKDVKCKYEKSKWGVLRAFKRGPAQRPIYELYELPWSVVSNAPSNIPRNELIPISTGYSVPAIEVDPMSWYYEEVLRRLGMFLAIGQPVTTNNLTRYYQYMGMKLGSFCQMYSYEPNTLPSKPKEKPSPAPSTPILTIRQQMEEAAAKATPPPPTPPSPSMLTISQQLAKVVVVDKVPEKKKKFVLTGG